MQELKTDRLIYNAIALTDAATIAIDAALGNFFTVTLGGNRTLGTPTHPTPWQQIVIAVRQDGTGGRTLAFSSAYQFNATGNLAMNRNANAVCFLRLVYNPADAIWQNFIPQNVPLVATLTDAATIAIDASRGNVFAPVVFDVTLAGNRTLGAPTNPSDGQKIIIRVKQDGTGTRTLAYNAIYRFPSDIPSPTLSTVASTTDILAFVYNAASVKWDCVSAIKGYAP